MATVELSSVHDSLQHLSTRARAREDISALVLYGLKLCQLKDKMSQRLPTRAHARG